MTYKTIKNGNNSRLIFDFSIGKKIMLTFFNPN